MPPINILIKPTSSSCNMKCKYCFYRSIAESRNVKSCGVMSIETLELLVKKALLYADKSCTFGFQGGEPTLVGLDFYKKFIEFVKLHNVKNVQVNYTIQTNGININEQWSEFLGSNKFLTGISLDGPKDIHDELRFDTQNKGTYSRVMAAISLFNRHKVSYNILCVVSSSVARHPEKVYSFFKKNNFRYLQFIPCLDPLDEKPGSHGYSLSPKRYGSFLRSLFDEWYNDIMKGKAVSIRFFDNLLLMLAGHPPEACDMSGMCTGYFVVEADGGVYPCDFYVVDNWYLGSILQSEFNELQNSITARNFIRNSRYTSPECLDCKYFHLCRGGCRRHREPFENNSPILNYYCQSFKDFYSYAGERLIQVARNIVRPE